MITITITADFDSDMSALAGFAEGMLLHETIKRIGSEVIVTCKMKDAAENFETLLNEPYFEDHDFKVSRED